MLKNKAARERYEHLYVPFMDWLVHIRIDWTDPGHLRPEVRQTLLRMLLDSAEYMGSESSKLLMPFYEANSNLDSLDIDHNQHYLVSAPKEYRRLYFAMSSALLKEGTILANTLKLPDMPGTIAKQFGLDRQS